MARRHYNVKRPQSKQKDWVLAEDRRFRRRNPHRAELRQVFDLAHVDFGRADYGMYEGRLQIWEINTNPTVLAPRDAYDGDQLRLRQWFAHTYSQAILDLD